MAILAILGLHAVAVAGLYHAGVIRADPAPDVRAIKVAFLMQKPPEAPPPPMPRLEAPPPVNIPVLRIDIPVEVPPPPTAITLTAALPQPPASPPPASQGQDVPVAIDTVDYLYQEPLRYPPQAKRARAQGVVYLRVVIDPEGLPREVRVHRSSGHHLLDGAACDAVQKFRFRPYRHNGVPHSAQVIVPVEFSLKSRST